MMMPADCRNCGKTINWAGVEPDPLCWQCNGQRPYYPAENTYSGGLRVMFREATPIGELESMLAADGQWAVAFVPRESPQKLLQVRHLATRADAVAHFAERLADLRAITTQPPLIA